MRHRALAPPDFSRLGAAIAAFGPVAERLSAARDAPANAEGGDVVTGSERLVVRHLAHYVAAVSVADRLARRVGTVVDAGSGTGGLATWTAEQLGSPELVLIDHDPVVRRLAAAAWPRARIHAGLDDVAPGEAELVTAMEVIEHVVPHEQAAFVAGLARLVAPGGALVLSTPDERAYPGGWSGYKPHVGVLDAEALRRRIADATDWPVAVWRLVGPPFTLGTGQRLVEPVVNRLHAAADRLAPGAVATIQRAARPRRWQPPPAPPVAAIAAGGGQGAARVGSGLLAVAVRPDPQRFPA